MKRLRRYVAALASAFSIAMVVPAWLAAGPLLIDDFGKGLSAGWEKKIFKGETVYAPVIDEGRPALKAESRATASALIYRISLDPVTYPRLSWSWKIARTIRKGDERTKAGDDYTARVYVVFPSVLFWRTRAVNYIWANRLPRGAFLPNAYTGNAVMVAVESGDGNAGRWVDEERDLVEDYRRAFGEDPPRIGAVAIMTDTDNTEEQAVAWYGAIRFMPPGPGVHPSLLDTVVWYGVHRMIMARGGGGMAMYTIGLVARHSGVGIETIRFYEREGLIVQPSRPESGFRQYPPDTVARVRFIQRSKALGFSLKEIGDLLSLRVDRATTCPEVRKRAEAKIGDIEKKIETLLGMKRALEKLTAACRKREPTGECPILEALGDEPGGIPVHDPF